MKSINSKKKPEKNNNSNMKENKIFLKVKNKLKDIGTYISNEKDYMIFLVMLLVLSILFEPYGLSKTLPLIIIVPFALSIFYANRKKIIIHEIIAVLILATVHRDAGYAAFTLIIATFCTYSAVFLSKYMDEFKRYKFFKKTFYGLIAFGLILFSFAIYTNIYGSPGKYLLAQNSVMNFVNDKYGEEISYVGVNYNFESKLYEVEYRYTNNYDVKIIFEYNHVTDEVIDGCVKYRNNNYETDIITTLETLISEEKIEILNYIDSIKVNFDENIKLKIDEEFDFKTPIGFDIIMKNKIIDLANDNIENQENDNNLKKITEEDLYFVKSQIERLTYNLKDLNIKGINNDEEIVLTASYLNSELSDIKVVKNDLLENSKLRNDVKH